MTVIDMKKTKVAFTMAEILITLMIIGVIAAMTIPSLQEDARRRSYAVACKKAFSSLSGAISMAELEYGDIKRWGLTDTDTTKVLDRFSKKMNITKTCYNKSGCLGKGEFYQLNGAKYTSLNANGYGSPTTAFETADGMSWVFDIQPNSHYMFFVDVNTANQAPNTLGEDVFLFRWYPDKGLVPEGYNKTPSNIACGRTKTGVECAALVLRYGDLNYDKHIKDELAGKKMN